MIYADSANAFSAATASCAACHSTQPIPQVFSGPTGSFSSGL